MPSDQATFLTAFAALFGLILVSLWRLDATARRLERRLAAMEADAKAKSGSDQARP